MDVSAIEYDHLTCEFGSSILTLREELQFHQREIGGQVNFFIEDPVSGSFYRVGYPEYSFLTLLDGNRTVDQCLALNATAVGDQALSFERASTLCRWLIESELATTPDSKSHHRQDQRRRDRRKRENFKWLNPMMLSISLGSPNRFFTWLNNWIGRLISFPFAILWVCLVSAAILCVCQDWERFLAGGQNVFVAQNWIPLALTWISIKLLHEVGHGIMCKRFGGEVRNCGITLILLMPLPFVDVTSCWRFRSIRQRVLTSAAGMIFEIALAAMAVFVWSFSDGFVAQTAYNVIISAGLTTLLFNANPLMRFDGYHILTDVLGIPNLSTHGQSWFRAAGRHVFFGFPMPKPKSGWRHKLIAVYGLAAAIWKVLILCSITLAAYSMLEGVGLLLALLSISVAVVLPTVRILTFALFGHGLERPNQVRFATVVLSLMLALAALGSIPIPGTISAEAVVDYEDLQVVRARAAGFVSEIHVDAGEQVVAGQHIATLHDEEAIQELEKLQADLDISQQLAREYRFDEKIALYQAELEKQKAIVTRLSSLEESVKKMKIRSPISGRVVSPSLSKKLGQYLNQGDELLSIGAPQKKKLVALVPPNLGSELLRRKGAVVRAWTIGNQDEAIHCVLEKVDIRATKQIPHEALTAVAGGTLPVQPVGSPSDNTYELTEPQICIHVTTNQEDARRLFAGQKSILHVKGNPETLLDLMRRLFWRWLIPKLDANHGVI